METRNFGKPFNEMRRFESTFFSFFWCVQAEAADHFGTRGKWLHYLNDNIILILFFTYLAFKWKWAFAKLIMITEW